jgi:hypothetical protein
MPLHNASHLGFRWPLNFDCEISPPPYIICLRKDLRRIGSYRSGDKFKSDHAGIFSIKIILSYVIEAIIIDVVPRMACIWFSPASDTFEVKSDSCWINELGMR